MATEEPAFTSGLKEGAFEVRNYPALVAAPVSVPGTGDEASSSGFKRLAGYMFGGNTRRQSIAMTAPVVQSKPGSAEAGTVRFIMPAAFTMDALPTPNKARVQLLALPPTRSAVLMFSSLAHEDQVSLKTAELTAFMAAHDLRAAGLPALERDKPPWTRWFMRRKAVQIPVVP